MEERPPGSSHPPQKGIEDMESVSTDHASATSYEATGVTLQKQHESEHTTAPSAPLPVSSNLGAPPIANIESNKADEGDSGTEVKEEDTGSNISEVHELTTDGSTRVKQPDDADEEVRDGASKAGPPELSTSPSSLSQSLSSALVAAMKVPSFSGAFKRTSSSAPEQVAFDLNERTPSDEPSPAQSSPPPSTSYFPSPASFTSFFSGGSKPRAIPSSSSPPAATASAVSAPSCPEPLQGRLAELLTSAGTSAPTAGAQTVDAFRERVGSTSTKEPVSANPDSVSASSLTQLMKAAAPYFGSGSKQPSDPEAGAGQQSMDVGRSVTSSPELPVSTPPPERHFPIHLDLEQAPVTLTRDIPPVSAPLQTSPGIVAPDNPPSILPGSSAQTVFPGAQPQETQPGTNSQDVQPGSSAQATSPGTSYLSLPSFLPTWSTITAQLPSMPGAPFINRDQERAVEPAQKPTAANQSLSTPPSDSGGDKTTGQSVGASTEGVDASAPRPGASQHFESLPILHINADRAGFGSAGTPPSVRESSGRGVSQPGSTEQPAPKPELDPPGAAAADAIARGLAGVFGPVTMEADKQIEAALRSQEKLAMSIDRLTRGLDKLLEESPQPLVAQQAARLAHMRKRVQALAAALKVIQGRIDSMNWALDRKSSRVPFVRGRSATAPNSPHSYQALTESVGRNRQTVPGSQSGGSGTHVPDNSRPRGSDTTGSEGQDLLSSASISRGADVADADGLAAGRVSSRSPDKGHRRAMSHDVQFSAGLSNKG